ncbi:hypothetical protein [Myroides odoratus]|uniref:hypothetical protein n=1 Tax=Myroides odoratus TaxID=256 RepID=UPI00333F14B3
MNKEEILIEVYRLCEEIKEKGKDPHLSIYPSANKINLFVFEGTDIVFLCYSYFDINYEEIFPEDNREDIEGFIPAIKEFITSLK